MKRLNKVNANIVGVILNKFKIEGENSQYGYYGMYYQEDKRSRKLRKKKNNIFKKKK